jgi:multidrug efflux pump subunit AcrB
MTGFNLSALAVRERALTLFLIIAIAVAGAYAFVKLGRAEDPPFTVKALTVTTAWPGATAQEMQDLVAEPLEKRMQELRWYDRVETMTRPGLAFMTLTLKDSTPPAEVPEQFYQARKKLGDEARNLPSGVLGPFVNDEYSDVTFALYALKAPGMVPRLLVRQAEAIRQQLLHVPGVKKVNILGERPERIFVEFSYPRLVALGISAQDIFAALQRQNTVTPAGSIDTKGPQVFVRVDGAYDDLQKIADTPIVAAGRNLKLSDIAEVRRGYEDPATFLIRHQGDPALALGVVMQEGWNGLDLGKALEAETGSIASGLPLGVTLTKITDQAVNISDAVDEFMIKFFVALGVVLVVSLLSLGWRVGIVVAAAVPLTLAAVFVIMLDTGRAFDRITLGALILALGLLVDDAIIAVEAMVVKMEEGMDRIQAAAYAWSHTAAPMLSGTLVTTVGLMPVGFARSSAGEYAGNIFWIVGFALIVSWIVAVAFTPYLGVKLLPAIKPIEGGHDAIYATPTYRRLRRLIAWSVRHKFLVAGAVVAVLLVAGAGMGAVKQQFFPTSDRPEVLVEVQMPEGSSIEATAGVVAKVEGWLKQQPEAEVVTSYIGQGAPRFFLAMAPELPDPSFAKIVILTPGAEAREALKLRLRQKIAEGLAPEARLRATQLVFGPYSPFPVAFRVTGPDPQVLRGIADQVEAVMRANPDMRQVNRDWGERAPTERFVLDQDRLRLIGLSPAEAAQQLQFLLTGVTVTQVREDIRTVDVVARSAGAERLDPDRLADFTLTSRDGHMIPLEQIGHIDVRMEDPILRRRDRMPTITVRGDIDETLQPPEVSMEVQNALQPIMARLPEGYRIETAGAIEESAKANVALAAVFPVMVALMLTIIMVQVRSFSATGMVMLTAPLGLVGAVPTLLLFHQPFGFNAILGLIGLAGILMRNTLILIGQIHTNRQQGLDPYHAVVEATVQRARPVILTAVAAVLAFVPLTQSVFWGSLAYTLIGGTALGTVLILVFLPVLYAVWFRVRPLAAGNLDRAEQPAGTETPLRAGTLIPTSVVLEAEPDRSDWRVDADGRIPARVTAE